MTEVTFIRSTLAGWIMVVLLVLIFWGLWAAVQQLKTVVARLGELTDWMRRYGEPARNTWPNPNKG